MTEHRTGVSGAGWLAAALLLAAIWSMTTPAAGAPLRTDRGPVIENLIVRPNPFAGPDDPADVRFQLSTDDGGAWVTIEVFSLGGDRVATVTDNVWMADGHYAPGGDYTAPTWDGRAQDNRPVLNGRYLVRMRARTDAGTTEALTSAVVVK